MIFGRKKKARDAEDEAAAEEPTSSTTVDADDEPTPASEEPDDTATDRTDVATDDEGVTDEDALDTAELDATEWRTQGPFEVSELADAEPDPDAPRIDLGSLVIAPVPGSELRLQVNEAQEIVSAMLVLPVHGPGADGAEPEVVASSALELSAYAAPRSGGLWAELRDEISEAAAEVGGSAELAAGPFGVELRRLLPVTTPTGEQGYQPSRMWVAEGPRWLLRGIVYGQAAITDDEEDPAVASVLAAFRDVVVRRGDEAMAPGDLLPMSMPADLQPAD
ncbi:DUF3710 domain-containing protein [Microlunatus flavus]|uniref:DUF3710 domain-containing protein n=1 Tax=Microlunatus flavus TaxID=1036181 RepID=A0A1H9NJL5_9ACTN|nr:DUF3710 domain-containing protein [Microlunatus flavus]SER35855.1 Protein of unknown function [Microlunatus flavus]